MFRTYGWYPSIFSIKNAEFSFCFYILCFIYIIWWRFGKENEDLYSDAQVASHPWFTSAPYFRCHYANVSLSLCLHLIKVIFRYLPFPLCLPRNVFFQFYSYMFLFFLPFSGSVITLLNGKIPFSLGYDNNREGEVSFVLFTHHMS